MQLMAENLSIRVLGESESPEDSWGNSAAIIGLELDILGEVVDIRISAAQRQATLADIVPLARILSTKLVSAVLDRLRKEQKFVLYKPSGMTLHDMRITEGLP